MIRSRYSRKQFQPPQRFTLYVSTTTTSSGERDYYRLSVCDAEQVVDALRGRICLLVAGLGGRFYFMQVYRCIRAACSRHPRFNVDHPDYFWSGEAGL